MNKLLLKISIIFLLPGAFAVNAEENPEPGKLPEDYKWYTVEVITLSRDATASVNEKWPFPEAEMTTGEPLPLATDTSARTLGNPDVALSSFEQFPDYLISLANTEGSLSKHAYSLNRAGELSVKSHQVWRQAGLSRETAPWVEIESDSNDSYSGKIQLSLSRYLHVRVDIQLANPNWASAYTYQPDQPARTLQAETINFKAHRRIRTGELHYIDHPLAGVIVKVDRYELPKTTAVENEQTVSVKTN